MTSPALPFKVGDVVVFSDDWFTRRRMPVPPIEERNQFVIRVVGDDRIAVAFSEDGRTFHQILSTSWLQHLEPEKPSEATDGNENVQEADATSGLP